MNILKNVINGATSQFGREFGRAAANSILKGKNYYTIKYTNPNCIDGVDPQKVISFNTNDESYKDDEQIKFIELKNQKILNQWLYIGWFFICIPYIITTILYFKLYRHYNKLLKEDKSLATLWHDVKISDGRRKEGFYYRKELLVSLKHTRPLFKDEIEIYNKLVKSNLIKMIISVFLSIPALYVLYNIIYIIGSILLNLG